MPRHSQPPSHGPSLGTKIAGGAAIGLGIARLARAHFVQIPDDELEDDRRATRGERRREAPRHRTDPMDGPNPA